MSFLQSLFDMGDYSSSYSGSGSHQYSYPSTLPPAVPPAPPHPSTQQPQVVVQLAGLSGPNGNGNGNDVPGTFTSIIYAIVFAMLFATLVMYYVYRRRPPIIQESNNESELLEGPINWTRMATAWIVIVIGVASAPILIDLFMNTVDVAKMVLTAPNSILGKK